MVGEITVRMVKLERLSYSDNSRNDWVRAIKPGNVKLSCYRF